jgi:hydroxyacylglutathione hydrolase
MNTPQSNARFALTIEPDNPALMSRIEEIDAARQRGRPTVPSTPVRNAPPTRFFAQDCPRFKDTLGMSGHAPSEVFAEIRRRKDRF